MATFPVEQFKKEWIPERLRYAMIEALCKQGLLTEAQRQELCRMLQCEVVRVCDGRGR